MEALTDRFAAIDIGNSRIKILFRNRFNAFSFNDDWEEKTKTIFSENNTSNLVAGVSSVNNNVYTVLKKILLELGIPEADLTGMIDKQKFIDYRKIQGIGVDRVLGLIGATDAANVPLITVDCGTAVTINYLDEDYICKGGVIFPGPYTQLRSLIENTYALKETKLKTGEDILAQDTETAISNGIIYGIAASIKGIIEQIKELKHYSGGLQVLITGGGAKPLMPAMDKFDIKYLFIQDLVLKGIIKLLLENDSY